MAGEERRYLPCGLSLPGSSANGLIARRRAVLLVVDVLTPVDGRTALVVLLHGDVGHKAVRGGSVPVVLAWLEGGTGRGADGFNGAAFAPAAGGGLGHEERLAVGIGVASGWGGRGEVHGGGGERGRPGRRGDGVDVDI